MTRTILVFALCAAVTVPVAAGTEATAALQPTPEEAAEISSKRTMGMVKLVVGGILAVSGVSWMAAGATTVTWAGERKYAAVPLAIGGGMGAGGIWLIFSGVRDRAEAARIEAAARQSIGFAPVRGGGAVSFQRVW